MALTLPPGWADGWQGQALRFIGVGLTTAAIDFGVLAGLGAVGMSPYLARIASILVALVVAWWLNRQLTFRSAAPPSWREFAAYAATAAVGAAINYALYSAGLYIGLPIWLAFVIGTGVSAVFNFLRYRVILAPR
ncbi:GtrA family protein [Polymorphobacter fuscus]|nr:GtrA family protein [Polymorphobacter fuscus]NJC08143.1 putative flippase GtrA [Polymorphobacter fuscus]